MPKQIIKKIAIGAVCLFVGSAAVTGLIEGITGTGTEPKTEIVMEAEPDPIPDRSISGDVPETEADPEALIELPTAAKEPEPEAEPETAPPETKPAETDPPKKEITITRKDSSLSPELVEALEGVAAFWAPTGTKIHLNPFCRQFEGTVYAGTVAEANSVKDGGWCGTCSKYADENTKTNKNATPEAIAGCYSYTDYLNKIPAEAFDR